MPGWHAQLALHESAHQASSFRHRKLILDLLVNFVLSVLGVLHGATGGSCLQC